MRRMQFEILVDRAERPQKCTILPLDGRPLMDIRRFDRGKPIAPLNADVLLHMDGVPLDRLPKDELAAVRRISLVDCNWRRCAGIVQQIATPLPKLVRIPEGFVTAYPRRNKEDKDPEGGLATIEAVFIAAAFCGDWDESLFAKYHWTKEFLEMNAATFARYGVEKR